MQRIIIIAVLIFFSSCKNKMQEKSAEFEYMSRVVKASNEAMGYFNDEVNKNFDSKMKDPISRYSGQIWYPKMMLARKLSAHPIEFIDSIQNAIRLGLPDKNQSACNRSNISKMFFSGKLSDRIYDSLKFYQDALLAIDAEAGKAFYNEKLLPIAKDSDFSKEKFANLFFANKCSFEVNYNLDLIKSNILTLENKICAFFCNKVGGYHDHYEVSSAIVGQSSNVVLPGDKLTLMAGVGAFSTMAQPKIEIDNTPVSLNPEAVGIKDIIAPQKPGKYYVPVSIEYTKPNGEKKNVQYKITYTVVKAFEE